MGNEKRGTQMVEVALTGYPSVDRIHLQGIPEEVLNPEVQNFSMLAAFSEINKDRMDDVAIDDRIVGRRFTKREVRDLSLAMAAGLMAMRLKGGDKIALLAPNCVEGIILLMGANAVGIQVALLDPSSPVEQIEEEIRLHEPQLVLRWGDPTAYGRGFNEIFAKSKETPPEIVREEVAKNAVNEGAMLYLQTSGSTARPKVLPFDNRAIIMSMVYASNSTGVDTNDTNTGRLLCAAPWQHGYGWMPLFVDLIGGNTVVLAGADDDALAYYHEYGVSVVFGTEPMLKTLMRVTPDDANFSSLQAFFCAGAVASEWVVVRAKEFFAKHGAPNVAILNSYGISEALCVGTCYPPGTEYRPGSCGVLYRGPRFLIVDENLHEVKYGEVGELIVTSPTLCQGYYGNPEATAEAFVEIEGETWFKTGDYVSLEEDGHLYHRGRKVRFYIPEGVVDKVNCQTIEEALMSFSMVDRAAVVILPDGEYETSRAFVTLRAGADATGEGLLESLSMILRPFELPKEVVVLPDMPMMHSGKIDYRVLEGM